MNQHESNPYQNEHESNRYQNEREFNPFPNPAAETAALGAQLGQHHRELSRLRRAFANLVAACRAALLAERDGEADAWAYIRDELPPAPPGHPLHHPDTSSHHSSRDSGVAGGR